MASAKEDMAEVEVTEIGTTGDRKSAVAGKAKSRRSRWCNSSESF